MGGDGENFDFGEALLRHDAIIISTATATSASIIDEIEIG